MHYSSFGVTENFLSNFVINIKVIAFSHNNSHSTATCFLLFYPLSAIFNRNNLVVSDN